MNTAIFDEPNKSVRLWNLNLIAGITFILISLLIFIKLGITYTSLATVFSITLLFTGALEIISPIQNRELLNEWGLSFIVGILDLFVSITIIIISKPQISSGALTLIMGYVFLYRSIKLITLSDELKNYEAKNLGWVFLGSIIGVILSFILLFDLTFLLSTLLFFNSFGLLIVGISEIYFSFVFRKSKRSELAAGV